jgi:hypothetical protein
MKPCLGFGKSSHLHLKAIVAISVLHEKRIVRCDCCEESVALGALDKRTMLLIFLFLRSF